MRLMLLLIVAVDLAAAAGGGHDRGEESTAVRFKEGTGLLIEEHTAEAIGLDVAEVTERPVEADVEIVGQVFSVHGGEVHASAQVSAESSWPPGSLLRIHVADRAGVQLTGRVARVDTALAEASGQAEVILAMPQTDPPLGLGDFVHAARIGENDHPSVTAVPASAVLRTAFGEFVYVRNGRAFLRAPVKIGAGNAEWTEITDGLFAGDRVAVRPVEWLYLTELRLTKGGGHCH